MGCGNEPEAGAPTGPEGCSPIKVLGVPPVHKKGVQRVEKNAFKKFAKNWFQNGPKGRSCRGADKTKIKLRDVPRAGLKKASFFVMTSLHFLKI